MKKLQLCCDEDQGEAENILCSRYKISTVQQRRDMQLGSITSAISIVYPYARLFSVLPPSFIKPLQDHRVVKRYQYRCFLHSSLPDTNVSIGNTRMKHVTLSFF